MEPFKENGSIKEDLVIHKSNLSDIGNELFKIYYPKWSNYIDRGGNIENVKILSIRNRVFFYFEGEYRVVLPLAARL